MRGWVTAIVAGVGLLGWIGWRLQQQQAEAAEQKKQQAARANAPLLVETASVARRDLVRTFEGVGSVGAPLSVDLMPRVTARVRLVGAREGDRVAAGQVVLALDPADLPADVALKEAALAQARARLAEARLGRDPNDVGLTSAVGEREAALESAQARQEQARADHDAQVAAAEAGVRDAEGRVAAAEAATLGADAAIRTAQASLANARTRQQRQEALFGEGATARELLDNARTEVQVQEGALAEVQQRRAAAVAARDSARAQQTAAERQRDLARARARADLGVARATVAQGKATLASARAGTGRVAAYRANLQALEAAIGVAEADLAASRIRVAAHTLRAPFAGVVTRRLLDRGDLASPQQAAMTIQSFDRVWVDVAVPEEVSRRIAIGGTRPIAFDALSGKRIIGRVDRLLPAADPLTRQFTVRLKVDNAGGPLRPGMYGRVVFEIERASQVLAVPREAIKSDPKSPERSVVARVGSDGKAQLVPVQPGLSDGKFVEVRGELREGEPVVVMAGRDVRDGQAVKTPERKQEKR